jgi:hypothetical protein
MSLLSSDAGGAPAGGRLDRSSGALTPLIVGGGFAVLQLASSFFLPHIEPGQNLEIAT